MPWFMARINDTAVVLGCTLCLLQIGWKHHAWAQPHKAASVVMDVFPFFFSFHPSSCLSGSLFSHPVIWHNLRKRIIYSWSASSCRVAQIQGTRGRAAEPQPQVGSTDVGVKRWEPPLLQLVTAPPHTCLPAKLCLFHIKNGPCK